MSLEAVGIVSGSGIDLRSVLDEVLEERGFEDFEGLHDGAVAGHAHRFVFGRCGGREVVLQCGRRHFYEGCSAGELLRPVEVMAAHGVGRILFTNAAGGLLPGLAPGDLAAADEVAVWRLAGAALPERIAPDFVVDGCEASGRFFWMHGPCYETGAEVAALRGLGGVTVGMSGAFELDYCRERGIAAGLVSCVTNSCGGAGGVTHSQVLETAGRSSRKLGEVVRSFLCGLD